MPFLPSSPLKFYLVFEILLEPELPFGKYRDFSAFTKICGISDEISPVCLESTFHKLQNGSYKFAFLFLFCLDLEAKTTLIKEKFM